MKTPREIRDRAPSMLQVYVLIMRYRGEHRCHNDSYATRVDSK